jgi:hypothetical protein
MSESKPDRSTQIIIALIGAAATILVTLIPLWATGVIGGHGASPSPTNAQFVDDTPPPQSNTPLSKTHTNPTPPDGGLGFPNDNPAEIFLSRDSAPGGATVLVSGTGFAGGESIEIDVSAVQVATTRADSNGKFANVAIVVPTQFSVFAPQQFQVIARGRSSIKSAHQPLVISG